MSKELVFSGDQIGKKTQELYDKALREIIEKYDIDLNMVLCHGRHENVPPEMSFDKLYMFIQLLPKEFEGIKKIHLDGFKCGGKNLIFPVKDSKDGSSNQGPCPQGDAVGFTKAPSRAHIITDDDDQPMACLLDGTLYFVNDFIHSRSKEDFEVGLENFEYVFAKAVELGLIDQIKSGVEEKSKRSLENALRQQFTTRLEKELIAHKATKDTIIEYEKNMMKAVRQISAADKIIAALKLNIDDIPRALEKVWKNVARMTHSDQWDTITYSRTGIKAISTPVYIEYKSISYDMGRYEATLNFDGTCKIIAIDRRIESKYDHPHINDGVVCWGNFTGHIPRLIGSSEFDVALNMIHTFLTHYDVASPYKTIENWPKVEVKIKKAKKEEKQEMEASF